MCIIKRPGAIVNGSTKKVAFCWKLVTALQFSPSSLPTHPFPFSSSSRFVDIIAFFFFLVGRNELNEMYAPGIKKI